MKRQRDRGSNTISYPVYINKVKEDVAFNLGATISDLGRFLSGRQKPPSPVKATITTYTPCTSGVLEWTNVDGEHVAMLMRHNGRLVREGSVVILSDSPMPDTLLSHIARPTDGALIVKTHIHPSQLERGEWNIFIKTLTGKTITITANYGEPLTLLKERIAVKTGLAPDNQRLIHAGRQLDESMDCVGDRGLKKESTIHLVLRLRGGMMHVSSGRMDYCSTRPPEDDPTTGEKHIPAATICIENGPTFHCHPNVSLETVERMAAMEMDPDFFNNKTREELKSYAAICQQLSRAAIERLTAAILFSSQ